MHKFSKSRVIIFVAAFVLALAALLVLGLTACGDGRPTQEEQPGDVSVYTVTAEESDFYDVSGQTTKASEGTAAYVVIQPEFDAVSVDKVLYNGNECTKSAAERNRYEFTMPAENVEITVEYSFNDNTTDNFLTWAGDNVYTFTMTTDEEEEWYNPDYDGENLVTADVTSTPSQSGGYFTSHEQRAFSLNQSVVPDDALSVKVINASSSSNSAGYFAVCIDRSKISSGTAQVVLLVENGHKFGDAALLVCTITVQAAQS